MTVQNANNKNIYVGNGATTVFPFTFNMVEANPDHIKVYVSNDNGVDVETDNYTVDMDEHNITYPKNGTPLENGKKITIARELPLFQLLNLVNQGPFFAEELEKALDKEMMIIQQLKEQLSRTLSMGISVDGDAFNSFVPLVPGKSFRINDDGTGFETTEDPAKVLPLAQSALEETKAARDEAQEIKDSVGDGIEYVIDNIEVAKEAAEKAHAASLVIDEALIAAETAYNKAVEFDQKITTAKDTVLEAKDASLQYKNEAEESKTSANSSAMAAANSANEANEHAMLAEHVSKNVNVFVPKIDENGVLSFSNAAGLENPAPIKIVGPQGPAGEVDMSNIYTKAEVDSLIASGVGWFDITFYGDLITRDSNMPQYGITGNIEPSNEHSLGRGLLDKILLR